MSYSGGNHICTSSLFPGATLIVKTGGAFFTSTVTAGTSVIADGIPILWEQEQISISSSATAPSTSTSVVTSFTTTTEIFDSTDRGFSHAGKIGVGVGVPIGVIAIGCILGFWFYRQHQGRNTAALTEQGSNTIPAISELAGKYNTGYELQSSSAPQELSSEGPVARNLR
jgi:hypothetical protein